MLVLEIAGGIILAIVLLCWWREILAVGIGGAAAVLGVVVLFGILNALAPLSVIMPWLVLLGLAVVAWVVLRSCITGKWNQSEEEARDWAAKSRYDKWVHRIAMSSVGFTVGGGALVGALHAIGCLK